MSALVDRYLLGVVIGTVFLTLFVVGLMVFAPLFDYARHRRRVSQVERFRLPVPAVTNPMAVPEPASADRGVAQAALAVSSRLVGSARRESVIADRLERAGIRIRPNEWVLLRLLACVAGAVVFVLPFGPVLGVILGGLSGFLAMTVYRTVRTERRYQAFAAQLPDALQFVIGSLRSGFSLPQAIDGMIKEASEPVSGEFARALAETRLGADLEDALDRLATRMHSRDLAWCVVAMRIQREVGGNLAEVLAKNVTTMREREALRRHVRALAAEGRMSAYLLIPLPMLVGLLLLAVRRPYILPMFTTGLGLLLITVASVLIVVGGLWMWRLVKVEV